MLEIKDLSIQFSTDEGLLYAVNQVNLSIQPGEAIAVVGESGAGKSQIFQAVMGLLAKNAQTTGDIVFKQQPLLNQPDQVLNQFRGQQISMIFQDPMTALNPYLKIGLQLMEVLITHQKMTKKLAKQQVIAMLKMVKLAHPKQCFDSYPHLLSGGMRQRVVIAMALLCRPDLLIADEATTALDVTIQAQIMALLKEFYLQDKMAIVLITHDLPLALNFCDRIVVMYAGQIIEMGTTEDILYRPQHPYTQALLNAAPQHALNQQGRLHTIQGSPADPLKPVTHCAFKPRCTYASQQCNQAVTLMKLTATQNTKIDQQHQVACFHPLSTTQTQHH